MTHKLIIWLLLILTMASPAARAEKAALEVGILPILSTHALMKTFQPLREHLEVSLNQPVRIHTARDFRSYYDDLRGGRLLLALAPAHMARLLQKEAGLIPLASHLNVNRPLLVVARQHPLPDLSILAGKSLAIFDPLALNVIEAQAWLARQGLQAGRDYQVLAASGHNGVLHAVASGTAAMGVVAPIGIERAPAPLRDKLVVWRELPPTHPLVWVAHPRLEEETERVLRALLAMQDTPAGQAYLRETGYKGVRRLGPEDLHPLDEAADRLAKLLRQAQGGS